MNVSWYERCTKCEAKPALSVNNMCVRCSEAGQALLKQGYEDQGFDPKDVSFEKNLGYGAFGSVYLGEFKGKPAAIKLLTFGTENCQSFKDEIAVHKILGASDKIVSLFAYAVQPRRRNFRMFLVYEYMSHGSLNNFDMGQQNFPKLFSMALCICDAISFLHSNYISHNDIHEGNILLDDNFRPKLADFGLATVLSEATWGKIFKYDVMFFLRMLFEFFLKGEISPDMSSDSWVDKFSIKEKSILLSSQIEAWLAAPPTAEELKNKIKLHCF